MNNSTIPTASVHPYNQNNDLTFNSVINSQTNRRNLRSSPSPNSSTTAPTQSKTSRLWNLFQDITLAQVLILSGVSVLVLLALLTCCHLFGKKCLKGCCFCCMKCIPPVMHIHQYYPECPSRPGTPDRPMQQVRFQRDPIMYTPPGTP